MQRISLHNLITNPKGVSFIKFVYHTNSYKNIDLEINNTVYQLFPDDEIDTEKSAGVIKIRTASVNKLSAVGFLI